MEKLETSGRQTAGSEGNAEVVCRGDSRAIVILGSYSEELSLSIWSTHSQLFTM